MQGKDLPITYKYNAREGFTHNIQVQCKDSPITYKYNAREGFTHKIQVQCKGRIYP